MAEYVDAMPSYQEKYVAKGFPAPYLRTWNFEDDLPELLDEIDVSPPFFTDLFKVSQTLHPTPCTLHPAPYTLQPATCILNPNP